MNNNASHGKWKILAVVSTVLLLITVSAVVFFILGRLSVNKNGSTSEVEQNLLSPTVIGSTSEVEQNNRETPKPTLRRKPAPTSSQTKTLNLKPVAKLDGYVNSDGTGSHSQDIKVGFSTTTTSRGFLAFELSNLPKKVNVANATLRIFQIRVDENPFISGEYVAIDHLNYGETLDESDFAMPALVYGFSEATSTRSVGWREIDVTNYVADDLANARAESKFRLHFKNEDTTDSSKEYVYFESADDSRSTGNTPDLVVKYF